MDHDEGSYGMVAVIEHAITPGRRRHSCRQSWRFGGRDWEGKVRRSVPCNIDCVDDGRVISRASITRRHLAHRLKRFVWIYSGHRVRASSALRCFLTSQKRRRLGRFALVNAILVEGRLCLLLSAGTSARKKCRFCDLPRIRRGTCVV